MKTWSCGKCGKGIIDAVVLILHFKAPCLGVKMCVPCARKFLAKTKKGSRTA